MNNLLQTANRLLSDKKISILIVCTAIAARAIQLLFYLDSFFDTSFQVIATKNFVDGHGISTAIVNPADLSTVIYQPLINWPPGYSLLLAPFYAACGNNYLLATFVLEMLTAAAIIIITRKILAILDIPVAVINLFTIFTSFFIYFFYYTGSTDSISIAFLLGAVYFLLVMIKTNNKWISRSVMAGVCLLLSASLKYLFFPIVFTLPVFLFIYGYQNTSASARKAAVILFSIIAAGIAAIFFYQKSVSGSGTHISSTGRGFFPEHLLRAHPFIPSSFITPNTLRKLPGRPEATVMSVFRIIHVIVYLAIIFAAGKAFLKTGFKKASLPKTFLFLALAISLSVSLMLAALSLAVDKELMPPDRWWTYVEDARYYGVTDVLVHLSVFIIFYHYRKNFSGSLKFVLLVLPFLLIPEAIRGIVFTCNRVINFGKEKYYWQQEKIFHQYGRAIVERKQDSLHFNKTIISGSLYYANYRASEHSKFPVLEPLSSLNNIASFNTKEPVLLLAMIQGGSEAGFKKFIEHKKTELAGQCNGFYFYTHYVQPH